MTISTGKFLGEVTVGFADPESDHATVMVLDQEEWTPFAPHPGKPHSLGAAVYTNSRYVCCVYPPSRPPGMETFPLVVHISFKHVLNIAITDFRDMQRIKNELVGEECQAIQIFPAESHLVDGANQYHLWCFVPDCWSRPGAPRGDGIEWPWLPVGFFDGRQVNDTAPDGGRQRKTTN